LEAELNQRRGRARPPQPDSRLQILLEKVRHGTYFDCLEISSDVGTTGVREAWLRLSAELAGLRAMAAGSPDDLAALDQIEAVAADAFDVLSDPDLRMSYLKALA
jgi:hypothetical protein